MTAPTNANIIIYHTLGTHTYTQFISLAVALALSDWRWHGGVVESGKITVYSKYTTHVGMCAECRNCSKCTSVRVACMLWVNDLRAHTHTHARRVRPRPRGIYHFSTYAECSVTANTVRMRANINALIYANGVVISFFFLFCIEFYTQQPTTISNSTNCVCVLCVSLRGSQFGYVTPPCAHTRFEWAANATGSSGNFSVIAGGGDSTSHNRSENRKYDR